MAARCHTPMAARCHTPPLLAVFFWVHVLLFLYTDRWIYTDILLILSCSEILLTVAPCKSMCPESFATYTWIHIGTRIFPKNDKLGPEAPCFWMHCFLQKRIFWIPYALSIHMSTSSMVICRSVCLTNNIERFDHQFVLFSCTGTSALLAF